MTQRYELPRESIPAPPKQPAPPPCRTIKYGWCGAEETPESRLLTKVWQISNRLRNYDVYNELIKELNK